MTAAGSELTIVVGAVYTSGFPSHRGADSFQADTPRNGGVSASERRRELGRRRSRKEKLTKLKKKLAKATTSEKAEIARKLRNLTPGAEGLIADWQLEKVDR